MAAGCLALNLSLAKVAATLSLPVYLDSVGTILAAAMLPPIFVLFVAGSTSLLGALVVNPYFGAYVATQCAIGITAIVAFRWGFFSAWWKSLIAGFAIALVAVLVSAPVTAILFGGVTLSGTTAINAVLIASGQGIWKSVIGGSVFIESIDKPAAALTAWLVLQRLPAYMQQTNLPTVTSGEEKE